MKNVLSIIHPQLATQWHPTKNGGLLQNKLQQAQQKKLGGNVLMGADHEWPASITGKPSRVGASPYFVSRIKKKLGSYSLGGDDSLVSTT